MEKRIIFRLPDIMFQQVNDAVNQGKAKTPSALIRLAIEQFLSRGAPT